jgi:thioredoxin-like negative regulator of GroEL
MRAFFGGQAALALAEAGLADDARVKIAEQVERWPDDVQARMLAGDALALLGDAEAALAHYQAALVIPYCGRADRRRARLTARPAWLQVTPARLSGGPTGCPVPGA